YRHSALKGTDVAVVLAVEFSVNPSGLSSPIRYGELAKALDATEGQRFPAEMVRQKVLELRASKAMLLNQDDHDSWSVGSFFTNPIVSQGQLADIENKIINLLGPQVQMPQFPAGSAVKLSAGWLIEKAGFSKGFPGEHSTVRLSTKHTLALTHRGNGTTAELLDLARKVQHGVQESFGVTLTPEPILVGCVV
ncbi:MAG: UDP-N-acetylmuramate dehydrogenase, partial [Mycobacteriaceae bacterium]